MNKENKYSKLVPSWLSESPNFSVVITNMEGRYTYVNELFKKRYAFLKTDLIGSDIAGTVHKDDLPKCAAVVEECMREPGKTVSTIIRKPEGYDGVYYTSLWDFTLLQDEGNQPVGIVCIGKDITEAEIATKRAKDLTKQLNEVVDGIREGFIELDEHGIVLKHNGNALKMLNQQVTTLKGKRFGDLLPYDYPQVIMEFQKALLHGIASTSEAYIPETERWLSFVINPSISGLQVFLSDITENKSNQTQLEALLDLSLKHNERLKEFTHIVSHNLKSHSNNIQALLSYIREEVPNWSEITMAEMLNKASERLSETVSNLAEVAHMTRDTVDELTPISLNDTLDGVLSSVASDIVDFDVKVRNNLPKQIDVNAIPAFLDSIVLNLITNAIRYRSEKDPQIEISGEISDGYFLLSVSDNGLGIDLDKHGEKLFGLYRTFHGHPDATGIGLYITRSQVEAMGGYIKVESKPGEGSTFTVALKPASVNAGGMLTS